MSSDDSGNWWFLPSKFLKDLNLDDLDEISLNGSLRDVHDSGLPDKQIISDDLMRNLNVYLNILLCGCVAVIGSLSNVINLIVFKRMGLKDSMTVCLFFLALTDFLLSFIITITRVFPIWDTFFNADVIDPIAVKYVIFDWVLDALYICTGWITTILSLERCVCVTFPFKVKRVFTRNRSFVAIAVTYIIVFGVFSPVFATHWLGWVNLDGLLPANKTSMDDGKRVMVIMFSRHRAQIEFYVNILSVTALPLPSLVLVQISVIWMVYALYISSRTRISMVAKYSHDGDGLGKESKMEDKTRRLVKTVLLLAIIFTLCSVPRCFATYMNTFNPEVNEGGNERNLSVFQWQFAHFASALNASVNIFVYLKINSSYRQHIRQILTQLGIVSPSPP